MHSIFGLLVGLGIFLYGMHQLESAAKDLSGHRLKSWLLHSTNTPLSSISSGIFLTSLLQSSSLVGLIVLAFASAEVIPLINAIGVFLGANLGTTLTGWIVTLLGFKLDIAEFALPMMAMGGISQIVFGKPTRENAIGALILGLGLLLFGLSLMKGSVGNFSETFSINNLQDYHPIVYVLIGIGVTAIIQSSSAMMMIVLTSLHAEIIDLPIAAALVIGADLGTTSTIVLGSITGNTIKRQLAFAHCFFNLVVGTIAYFLILPFLEEILAFIHLSDPLFGVVAFHSFFNLIGLFLFLPFLKPFARWIESLFKKESADVLSLSKLTVSIPATAIPIAVESIRQLWLESAKLNLSYFDLTTTGKPESLAINKSHSKKQYVQLSDAYENLKVREGDILQYILNIQEKSLTQEQITSITACIETIRAIVYGSKTLKDIHQDIEILNNISAGTEKQQFVLHRDFIGEFYQELLRITQEQHPQTYIEELLTELTEKNDQHKLLTAKSIYTSANNSSKTPSLVSTQLNASHEIHHALKSFILGLSFWKEIQGE